MNFARILVEVDISQPLLKVARLKTPGGTVFEQEVIYEWVPIFCQKCQCLGHKCKEVQNPAPGRREPVRRNRAPNNEWVVVGMRPHSTQAIPVNPQNVQAGTTVVQN